MKFIIQYNLISERQLQKIKKVVEKYPHEYVGVIPFSHEITSDEPLEGTDFIPYGSCLMVNLAKEKNWKGVYFDLDKFNYRAALENRDDMLNDNIMTIKEAIVFLKKQDTASDWFLRPSEDLKKFSGMVINAQEAVDWLLNVKDESSMNEKLNDDTEIVVSIPKNIQAEWRWFIVGGKVINGSLYRMKGQTQQKEETDEKVIAEAQEFANKWLPHENCVMDIALVDGVPKVIEFNNINGSGFYDHDVEKVFGALWENANLIKR